MKTLEQEIWESCQYRMDEEGFDYCFTGYSHWKEIKDDEFHKLRESYLQSMKKLRHYVDNKANQKSINQL